MASPVGVSTSDAKRKLNNGKIVSTTSNEAGVKASSDKEEAMNKNAKSSWDNNSQSHMQTGGERQREFRNNQNRKDGIASKLNDDSKHKKILSSSSNIASEETSASAKRTLKRKGTL